ncbi:hypothetical protein, partial [Bartonella bovis]|uniref:hypothetical protein n=1 Tax=Bartonella bovis TaxID=155194 RepID=UPI001304D31A
VLIKGTGMLTMNKGEITFKSGKDNYGIGVWGEVTANITGTRISGGGATGTGVIMGGTEMTMTGVQISKVKMGVYVQTGTVTVSGGR